jgi:uridine kinase
MAGEEALNREECLARIAERIGRAQVGHPVRVAIDGPDAAGKTSLADELARLMRAAGTEVIRASVDRFHRPRAQRYARGRESPEGYYRDSFNYEELLASLLVPLGPGGSRVYRAACFDLDNDEPLTPDMATAADDAVLLVDGVFLQRSELRAAWDVTVFVTADFEELVRRARQRDARMFGSPAAAESRYRTRYIPGQQLYLAEARPEDTADIVVRNDQPAVPLLRSN